MDGVNASAMDVGLAQFASRNDRPGRSAADLAASATNADGSFNMAAARATAEEFEATFLSTLVDTMFSGLETDGPFGGGQSEGMFRSMLNQEYAKAMSGQGGLGLADNVLRSMLEMQGLDPALADEDVN